MSKKLKKIRFASFAGGKITFRVVSQKSHQRLPWRRTIDKHFVFHPFFCTTNLDSRTIPHLAIGMIWRALFSDWHDLGEA